MNGKDNIGKVSRLHFCCSCWMNANLSKIIFDFAVALRASQLMTTAICHVEFVEA